ncbi:alpha/beta hydrolase [Nocardia puris]|uniref:Acetyl esterase n=1 Tax=Nocardia puris TaxID=208602 RepID=A0A366DRS0_9NOCA|nr:alpha/beta hydrolase [Nocardia puris]MBF6210722.1 alpha/beta hydrolase [Nocardia puris]MBF6364317.1 alpha/beta hydrolase [Nocardia puris]MBF6459246.1 alpha/beta hydrolase [Nocardia puris]RBO92800.1 acetyl esterase [Nocardia puris]
MSEGPPSCWNLLDDNARAVAEAIAAALPAPLRELGPELARTLLATQPADTPRTPVDVVEVMLIPTRAGAARARLYRRSRAERAPALLYLHGGGFVLGTLDGVDELCRAIAARTGWAVISLEYRLAPEAPYPAALEDAVDAFAWLRASATSLGIDPAAIAVGGDSAGGNLAAALCLAQRDACGPMPVAQVLAYPAVDNRFARHSWTEFADAPLLTAADAKWCYGLYAGAEFSDALAAPMRAESLRGLPPALIVTAEVDPIRDDAEAFAARLAAEEVPATAIRYDGVFHGFFPEIGVYPQSEQAIGAVCEFLRRMSPPDFLAANGAGRDQRGVL